MNDIILSPPTSATGPDEFAVAQAAPESLTDKAHREYLEAQIVAPPSEAEIRSEIPGAEPPPAAEPGNIVEASDACLQADPLLAGIPEPAAKPALVFTPEQLAKAGVVFQATDITKFVEINAAAQTALVALAPGHQPNEIVAAILGAYGIEGQVQTNTHPATQTLSFWQSTESPKDDAASTELPTRRGVLTTEELLALHESTCAAGREIMRAKNNDYCDGAVDCFANFRASETLGVPAEIGLMIRMLDKMKRVQTFVNKGTLQVKGESVEDSILDLVNYSILLKGIIVSRRLTEPGQAA
jgi:hypothetical protein